MPINEPFYQENDGLRYILEQKQISGKDNEFPRKENYVQIFNDLEQYLNKNVHTQVVAGAAANGSGLLNDHGPVHVEMVICKARDILGDMANRLSGYEIFLLLLSIHFHDVGNIFGREDHEQRISEVMEALGNLLPFDYAVKSNIMRIAMAHGGNICGEKDTISELPDYDHLEGQEIRPALLAAVLRYADEISDDHTRANRFLMDAKAVPENNIAFHEYSKCLEQPAVRGDTLLLKYSIPYKLAKNRIMKLGTQIYLYDEILLRIKKNLCELEYCRKYSKGYIVVSSLSVHINVRKENPYQLAYQDNFKVRLSGYPNQESFTLCDRCESPESIKILSGDKLADHLK